MGRALAAQGHRPGTSTSGTKRMSAIDLAQKLPEQRPIRVYDADPVTDKRTLKPDATLAAQAKATELNDRFADRLWEDPDSADDHLQSGDRANGGCLARPVAPGTT
ncbi:hypothetical protein [Krasilnikovia sp. M28-CT-15]|uniref:hypothetical protein n=1 Tax=Krasilnikovia sp. M28-CT-15 TaxID=3373540 RepID=UPI00387643E9